MNFQLNPILNDKTKKFLVENLATEVPNSIGEIFTTAPYRFNVPATLMVAEDADKLLNVVKPFRLRVDSIFLETKDSGVKKYVLDSNAEFTKSTWSTSDLFLEYAFSQIEPEAFTMHLTGFFNLDKGQISINAGIIFKDSVEYITPIGYTVSTETTVKNPQTNRISMLIHQDHNGLHTFAVSKSELCSEDMTGHLYHFYSLTNQLDTEVRFQQGPVKEVGVNGITNEALLAVLIDRTKYLDKQFPCDENKRAIQHMEEALVNLEVRSARRIARGVEGTNQL